MTLRDLTKRQLYNLRRRCEKEKKEYIQTLNDGEIKSIAETVWNKAYDKGLKAGLGQKET